MSIVETLSQASNALLMPSESDYPFEPFIWLGEGKEVLTTEKLLQLTNHPINSPVETVDLDYLFRNVAQEQEWHDAQQKANVSKFKSLIDTLKANLKDLKVYRVGIIEIDVYIVGKAANDLAGLATKVVET
ncbi:nuclease A inhibitor family protein [Iningainema tapete]|uniref:Nuclease A inhibitor family protein n=1 Tax=Iningainema tapete BLCC-T55 TaxID=2748662 RepID=A0A8J7BYD3_9CYAN|nr:nuclease A inhibitor family protein [Iningainema tapete]MBD2775547.1 nuclease A inhibitor family protein [Iningainema tapete BLCC-T55]